MSININVMDIKADLKWIQKELKEVKDPTFIEAIKICYSTEKMYPRNVSVSNSTILKSMNPLRR